MLNLPKKEFNLGRLSLGKTTSFQVEVENDGDQTIFFEPIGTSCTCTSGYLEKNPLPPHTKTKAIITFNSNKTGKGDFVKSANLKWKIKTPVPLSSNASRSELIKFKIIVE